MLNIILKKKVVVIVQHHADCWTEVIPVHFTLNRNEHENCSSGATCSGKTSLASLLEKVFPRASVVNLDKYYYEEDSPHHVRDHKTKFINWEVLEAFNMNQMHRDIFNIQEKVK